MDTPSTPPTRRALERRYRAWRRLADALRREVVAMIAADPDLTFFRAEIVRKARRAVVADERALDALAAWTGPEGLTARTIAEGGPK